MDAQPFVDYMALVHGLEQAEPFAFRRCLARLATRSDIWFLMLLLLRVLTTRSDLIVLNHIFRRRFARSATRSDTGFLMLLLLRALATRSDLMVLNNIFRRGFARLATRSDLMVLADVAVRVWRLDPSLWL